MTTISDGEILNLIRSEASNTIGTSDSDSQLGMDRADSIDYYHGKMDDAPHEPGWSGITTRDVFNTIESALPDIIEIFESTEDIMEFAPEDEDDVDKAAQETDVVNYIYNKQNPGFINTYTFIKDSLMVKNGFMKASWEDRETSEEEHYFDQTNEDLAILQTDEDIEVIDVETETKTVELGEGLPDVKISTHAVIIKRTKDTSQVVVQALPPEEIAVSREATDLQKAALVRHEPKSTTRSDLLELGISEEKVTSLRKVDEQDNEEEIARDTLNQDEPRNSSNNRAMEKVDVADNYIRMDARGNGRAELWHVMTGNDDTVLLSKTRISRVPISTMTPIIETHQLYGISLSDLAMSLQRVTTFFTRAAIDNTAALNNQRPIISQDAVVEGHTLDDLLINRTGSPILVKGDARAALAYAQNNVIAPEMIGMIQYFDQVRAERTGISRNGQDMDPDAIRKDVSATEFAGQRADALKTIKLMARIFAETGMKDVMINIHHAAQSHSGNRKRAFRLNGKFVQVNPREWRTRTDMTINLGLGTGTKNEQIGQLRVIRQDQIEAYALQGNVDGPMVRLEQIRHTEARMIELMGFKDANAFFNEIDEDAEAQRAEDAANADDPVDPAMEKVRLDAQNDADRNRITQQKNQTDALITQQNNQAKIELEAFRIVQELQLKAQELGQEFDFKTALAEAKLSLQARQIEFNEEFKSLMAGFDLAERVEKVDIGDISTSIGSGVNVGGEIAG